MTDLPRIGRPVGASEIAEIMAIEDPILRNRWITQAYHDLAVASSNRLGGVNQTWCAFAVWASSEAGVSIRMEEFPARISDHLKGSADYHAARGVVDRIVCDEILALVDDAARRVSAIMAAGNLQVFTDVGLAFAHFSAGAPLPSGLPDLSNQAFVAYAAAVTASDARSRAELVLLGNLRAVLYEQTSLNRAITAAMDLGVGAAARAKVAAHPAIGRMHRLLDDVERAVEGVWQDALTRSFCTLVTPSGVLRLEHDVPALEGHTMFPADLAEPRLPELVEFLAEYDRTNGTGVGSAARNWTVLAERMNYITNLFRSRQQDGTLLTEPFSEEVRRAIGADPVTQAG